MSSLSFVQDFKNFKASATPARFLAFCDGSWTDLRAPSDVLLSGFLAGRTTIEASYNGATYIFDFVRLSQTDMSTGASNPIAWIDVEGRCFFPRPSKPETVTLTTGSRSLKRKREEEEGSDESSTTSGPRWPGAAMLREGDRFYKVVEKLFMSGMRGLAPEARITSISRCSTMGQYGSSRLRRFQTQLQRVKAERGDGNLKFGWYGATAEDVAGVVSGGFARTNDGSLGSDKHGAGIHLSPPGSPYSSCVFSEPDSNGERHLVLCRVIMGKSERIPAGSHQFRPSSEQFDSGVDDLEKPKWYIVWDAHKNTHIHPEYVVSFRVKHLQGLSRTMDSVKKARVPLISARELIQEVGKSLPSARMEELVKLLDRLKAGEISTGEFFKHIRLIVGDKVLTNFAMKIRGH